jgi:hypothetical protein
MIDPSIIPEYIIKYIFNINQGSEIMTPCKKCDKATKQIIVSYEQLPALRKYGLAGRAFDVFPLGPVILGRPTLCECGTINRLTRISE